MAQKPETKFRAKVVKDLKEIPNCFIMSIQQRTIQGDPDLILCLRGHFIALELKSEGGRVSELQAFKLDKILLAQGMGYIVYPHTWPDIYSVLKKLGGEK